MATISIFIPVYNGERDLSRTLDSILGQNYRDIEVLCVDDSSTDNSYGILQDYASRDSRIRLFQKPNGGSVPPSWRYIIPHIKGGFVLYMSQDDLLKPDTLELLVNRQQETGADAVIPHEIHHHEGLPEDQQHHLRGAHGDITPILSGREAFRLMIDYSISGRALWPTRVVREIGMPANTFNADELAQRLWILNCDKVAFSDAIFLYCRDNSDAITTSFKPHTYDDTLTNALLYQAAKTAFPYEKEWQQQLAGQYFHHLYLRMIQYLQLRHSYSKKERKRIKTRFKDSYRLLHHNIHTQKRKYRIAATSLPLMWAVVGYKHLQLRNKGIVINQDMDCYSYTTI